MARALSLAARVAAALALAAQLAACATPKGAGEVEELLAGAGEATAEFGVVAVDSTSLPRIARWPTPPSRLATSGWLPPGQGVKADLVAPGDRFDLTIWMSEDNGLLTGQGQKNAQIQAVKVAPDGTVFLPYAGSVAVAGQPVEVARQALQDNLARVMPSAQVLLVHQPGTNNAVQVVGGLAQAGEFGMPDHDFTVLDLVAAAGGVPAGVINPRVVVTRAGKVYGIALSEVIQNPDLDAVLRPGDKVAVMPETRYFLSFGAASREATVPFPAARVSAMDALALIGGLNDAQADPKGVLVLRSYPKAALRQDGSGPPKPRMVFAFDLTTANGLFGASEFQIHDRDIVVVAQSPLVEQEAVINFIGRLLGLTNATSNALTDLGL